MPSFTPPVEKMYGDDYFFGRYGVDTGQSVVKIDGTFITMPFPWLGEIADLTEGTDYFLGGRTYTVTDAVATALQTDGYTTE